MLFKLFLLLSALIFRVTSSYIINLLKALNLNIKKFDGKTSDVATIVLEFKL